MKDAVADIAAVQPNARSTFAIWADLTKARLTLMVLLTTLAGFYLGSKGPIDLAFMFRTLLGTALLAGGAAILNQFAEREHDARMRRTAGRPLCAGEVSPSTALLVGAVTSAAGLIALALGVNLLASAVGALTLGLYLFLYTPLKRITPMNTAVGAVPGALPPLLGWAAARGEIDASAWSLFLIQFFWQVPHFMAIAWIYKEDYARAGFRMLPSVDPAGARTGHHAVSHCLGLAAVSLSPCVTGLAGRTYVVGALLLGIGFLCLTVRFAMGPSEARARAVFWASIAYLPLTVGLLVANKLGVAS